jgi:hypothetical protein
MPKFVEFTENGVPIVINSEFIIFFIKDENEKTIIKIVESGGRNVIVVNQSYEEVKELIGIIENTNDSVLDPTIQ